VYDDRIFALSALASQVRPMCTRPSKGIRQSLDWFAALPGL
jgi:hypothetical protein